MSRTLCTCSPAVVKVIDSVAESTFWQMKFPEMSLYSTAAALKRGQQPCPVGWDEQSSYEVSQPQSLAAKGRMRGSQWNPGPGCIQGNAANSFRKDQDFIQCVLVVKSGKGFPKIQEPNELFCWLKSSGVFVENHSKTHCWKTCICPSSWVYF